MRKTDPYKVLGVDSNASEDEIKAAYRKLVFSLHPDRNPGDENSEKKFKEVQEAYDGLTNKQSQSPNFGNPFDIFSEMFSGGRTEEIVVDVYLTFWEAAKGCDKEINIVRREKCCDCHGEGGTGKKDCETCDGEGVITQQAGPFRLQTTCPKCLGACRVPEVSCNHCDGRGWTKGQAKVSFQIPVGIRKGDLFRIMEEGHYSQRQRNKGSVLARITVGDHPYFTRNGDNLVYQFPVFYWQAVLGSKVYVPTLQDKEEITILPQTKSGKVFCLSGKGFANPTTGQVGDCLIEIFIDTPICKDKEYLELLEKMKGYEKPTVRMLLLDNRD